MNLSNLPLVTPLPRGSSASDTTPIDSARVAELRHELTSLAQTIAGVAAARVADVERLAAGGAENLRSNIEARPWTSLGVAAAAGALLAVAIVPKRTGHFRYNDATTYNAENITAAVRRAVAHGVDSQPITSRLERLVEAISKIDASAVTTSPAYDSIKSWLHTFTSSLGKS